jgi:hypothetical protein
MGKIVVGFLVMLTLAGCETMAENDRMVSIPGDFITTATAIQRADAHCNQYNRKARLNHRDPGAGTYVFDCVQ